MPSSVVPRSFACAGVILWAGSLALVTASVPPPLFMLLGGVALASACGGLRPGLFAASLGAISAAWTMPPGGSLRVDDWQDVFRLAAFVVLSLLVSLLTVKLRASVIRERAARRCAESTLESERSARTTASGAQFRLSLLDEASEILVSSLEYESMLQKLALLAVPRLGDCCAIDVLDEDQRIRRAALVDMDSDRREVLREMDQRYPLRADDLHAYVNVIRTGEPKLVPTITEDLFGPIIGDDRYVRTMRRLGPCSLLCVPLRADRQILGAITIVSTQGRRYGPSDLRLVEDLAHRVGLAMAHARLYRTAQQVNQIKDDFLAVLSHELRGPLSSALLCAQMLQGRALKKEHHGAALATIERNIRLQVRLVDDLLDISRIRAAKLHLEKQTLDVARVVQAAVDAARPTAGERGIELSLHLTVSEVAVYGDAARLQQVVGNLLSNGIKFTPEGGRIAVELGQTASHATIIIRDSGIGIPRAALPHIFDRSWQGDGSATRQYGGLGLGLTIVRYLVEQHSGRVSVHSAGEGRGTTFTVHLPRLRSDADRRFAVPTKTTPCNSTARLDGVRVLVVDDEEDARTWMAALLSSRGAEVATAGSAAEALQALKNEGKRDVLISDISMPRVDGYALLREIRTTFRGGGDVAPAIALTACASAADRERALEAGYRLHLVKPVDPREVIAAVAMLARPPARQRPPRRPPARTGEMDAREQRP